MGTEIALTIDGVDVDFSKNSMGNDHGSLFQEKDHKRLSTDYYEVEEYDSVDDPELAKREMGFTKKLKDVVLRLELMGYMLDRVKAEYERARAYSEELREDFPEEEQNSCKLMEFDQFLKVIERVAINQLNGEYDPDSFDKPPSSYGVNFIDEETLKSVPNYDPYDWMVYSEKSFVSSILDFLTPYSALRLLAINEANLNSDVVWHYGELVENGWAEASMFVPCARRRQKFLIITEGHTDAEIIDLAIRTLYPEIYDFFYFIDMTEGHPFGGTGNLQKFAKGLVKMDVQNKTLFLYDNDTEGLSAYRNGTKLPLPRNMKVAMLPELDEFKSFKTVGPSGEMFVDINKKAVAIECYLDLERTGLPDEPIVRWSGFKGDVKQYQGALIKKERYTEDFLSHTPDSLKESNYDLSKLQAVVDTIIVKCVEMA